MTVALGLALALSVGCKSTKRFSSKPGDHFEGEVVKGNFVRSGVPEDIKMCAVIDAEHFQDSPGFISTSDGRFRQTTLRPIPQIWHDPLSTLSFGDGRVQNMVFMATPEPGDAALNDAQDVLVVMSLMEEGGIEVRLLRGAPQADSGVATPPQPQAPPVFGVFTLERREGTCAF